MAVFLMIAINVCVDAGRWILFEQGFVSRVRGVDDAVAQCGALWTTTTVFVFFCCIFKCTWMAFFGSINYSMAHDFSRVGLTFPTFHHLEMVRI